MGRPPESSGLALQQGTIASFFFESLLERGWDRVGRAPCGKCSQQIGVECGRDIAIHIVSVDRRKAVNTVVRCAEVGPSWPSFRNSGVFLARNHGRMQDIGGTYLLIRSVRDFHFMTTTPPISATKVQIFAYG